MKNFRSPQRPKKSSMVIGKNAVMEALKEGKALDKIFLSTKSFTEDTSALRKLAQQMHVPVNGVPIEKLNGFNAGDHGGCIALLSKVHYYDLQQVITMVVEDGITPLFLILDGITDIRNIGGIARTAFCTGVQAIIIPDKGVGALNEDAILTSAGALEQIPICRVSSLMKAVDELHMNGIRVLATEMNGARAVYDANFTEPVALVLGSEEKGINPALLKICDERIKIPMQNEFESLNVSVATGIILYEAMKQRLLQNG